MKKELLFKYGGIVVAIGLFGSVIHLFQNPPATLVQDYKATPVQDHQPTPVQDHKETLVDEVNREIRSGNWAKETPVAVEKDSIKSTKGYARGYADGKLWPRKMMCRIPINKPTRPA